MLQEEKNLGQMPQDSASSSADAGLAGSGEQSSAKSGTTDQQQPAESGVACREKRQLRRKPDRIKQLEAQLAQTDSRAPTVERRLQGVSARAAPRSAQDVKVLHVAGLSEGAMVELAPPSQIGGLVRAARNRYVRPGCETRMRLATK